MSVFVIAASVVVAGLAPVAVPISSNAHQRKGSVSPNYVYLHNVGSIDDTVIIANYSRRLRHCRSIFRFGSSCLGRRRRRLIPKRNKIMSRRVVRWKTLDTRYMHLEMENRMNCTKIHIFPSSYVAGHELEKYARRVQHQ